MPITIVIVTEYKTQKIVPVEEVKLYDGKKKLEIGVSRSFLYFCIGGEKRANEEKKEKTYVPSTF